MYTIAQRRGQRLDAVAQAQAGRIGLDQFRAIWGLTGPARRDWSRWGVTGLLVLGWLALCVGAMSLVAYNWHGLHKVVKFALVVFTLTACAGYAMFRQSQAIRATGPGSVTPRSVLAALAGAQVCSGLLLAVIGQTYQTGADTWQLFALWFVLAIPWALAARTPVLWWIVLALGYIALLLGLPQLLGAHGVPYGLFGRSFNLLGSFWPDALSCIVLALTFMAALGVWAVLARRAPRWGFWGLGGPRLLALEAISYAAMALMGDGLYVGLGVMCLIAVAALFRWVWRDVLVQALLFITLLMMVPARTYIMLEMANPPALMISLLIEGLVLGVLARLWIVSMCDSGESGAFEAVVARTLTRFSLVAVQLVQSLLMAGCLWGLLLALNFDVSLETIGNLGGSVALCSALALRMWSGGQQEVCDDGGARRGLVVEGAVTLRLFLVILCLSGLIGLAVAALFSDRQLNFISSGLVLAFISALGFVAVNHPVQRYLTGLSLWGALLGLLGRDFLLEQPAVYLLVWLVAMEGRWAGGRAANFWSPLMNTLAVTYLAFALMHPYLTGGSDEEMWALRVYLTEPAWANPSWWGVVAPRIMLGAFGLMVVSVYEARMQRLGFWVGVAAVAFALAVSVLEVFMIQHALSAGLILLILGLRRCSWWWITLGFLALGIGIEEAYFSMALTFLQKAWVLLALGAFALMLRRHVQAHLTLGQPTPTGAAS